VTNLPPEPIAGPKRRFQIGLSYASEQRDYVEPVAGDLRKAGVDVFYDRFELDDLWGRFGPEHFHEVFAEQVEVAVMFVSEAYVRKPWTNHERRAILGKLLQGQPKNVLVVRFDDTPLPGYADGYLWRDASEFPPQAIAATLCRRIGMEPNNAKRNAVAPPMCPDLQGTISFDHTDHDGRYVIGTAENEFELKFSNGGADSVYIYNDPPSIRGVAIAKGATAISDVKDASTCNFTSRTRAPREGQVAVVENTYGRYAAVEIVDVKAESHGDDEYRLTLRYVIREDGGTDFSHPR
jgi:hypothetical protein